LAIVDELATSDRAPPSSCTSRLSPDDIGLQLLENAAATAGALIALIWMFGAVSGAHFNPARHPRRSQLQGHLHP
jgi:hypothetical protein